MSIFALINELHAKGIELWQENGELKLKAPKGVMTAEIRDKLVANKAQIIEFLQDTSATNDIPSIEPVDRTPWRTEDGEQLPLSFAQQRLWFIDSQQGGSPEYNMPMVFEVEGQLNTALLTQVFKTIIERHEVLRTVYSERNGEVLQTIRPMPDVRFEIDIEDLSHLSRGEDSEGVEQQIKAMVESNIGKPFDLASDLMLRVSYLQRSPTLGVLIFNMHHIASDGWSMEVLTKEFFALYEAYSRKEANPLPQLAIQYVDYAHWQKEYLDGGVLESQLSYWEKQLDELPATHDLPLDKTRPEIKQHTGAMVSGELSASTAKKLLEVAKAHQLTPFMLLHGALSLLLSRHSNSTDIVVGTPIANRLQEELQPLIGFFVNTLVLRVDTSIDTLSDYFAHIRKVHLEAQSNQDVPFDQLVERLKVPRSTAHGPLFQILMSTNTDYGLNDGEQSGSLTLPGLNIEPYSSDFIQAKFDFNVDISISEQGVGLTWTYDVSLFTKAHISTLNDHLCCLLEGLSQAQSTQALNTLPLLSAAEIQHLVADLNDNDMSHPRDKCIHELFEQQVADNPEQVAVCHGDKRLTYKQLNEKANQLAHYLRAHHSITPDTLVGLCMERSLEMLIGMIGILKAGGAYVPLDPSYPQERLNYMLEDAALNVVLSQTQGQHVLSGFNGSVLLLDGSGDSDDHFYHQYNKCNLNSAEIGLSSSNLAYVIYTSGSTGQPKGVLTEHISVARLVINPDFISLNNDTVMLQSANIAFDAATLEIWGPLLNGGQSVLFPDKHLSTEALNHAIDAYQVNSLWLTAGLFREWSYTVPGVSPLKYLLAGGDVLDPDAIMRVQQTLPELTLINGYGPTENTTFSTTYTFEQPHQLTIVPIGKRLSTDVAYILNDECQLVPYGTVGELCVGGDGLSRGYLNRPELTKERFIENPFYDQNNASSSPRLYKTGDLVRYLPDGNLAFIGRADQQVKVRGFRIELGEIEVQLTQLENVDSALVLAQEIADNQQLVAYVKPTTTIAEMDSANYVAELKSLLAAQLPEHMMPGIIMVVEQWPLTPNGKIDKKALPIPDGNIMQQEYVAAQTQTEQMLVDIWAGLLNIPPDSLSTTANFFEVGGHSLLCMRLISEVRSHFGVEITIQSIFDSTTLQALAGVIEQSIQSDARPPLIAVERTSDTLPVSFAQQRLWFIDNLQGNSPQYHMPVVFNTEQLNIALVAEAFNTIIERHEVLRTVYVEQDGQVLQTIRKISDVVFEINVIDFSHLVGELTDEVLAQQIKTRVRADINKPFDLATDLMLRVSYVKKTEQSGVMIFNMHHIASDGWSIELLTKEFFSLYNAYSQGQSNPLVPLDIQYADYALWQRDYLSGEVLESQLAYWEQQLSEIPVTHALPLDYARPAVKQHGGQIVKGQLSGETAQQLLELAKIHQLTPFMLLHGAFSLVLSRHSNSADIVIGSPVANRLQAELEPLIGFFINSLVLRVNTNHDTLADYFAHVRQVHLDGQSNQDVPFEQLVERLNVPRSTAHGPIFQISMTTDTDYGVNDGTDLASISLPGVKMESYSSGMIQAMADINLRTNISEQGVDLEWTYDVSLLTEQRVTQLNEHMCRLLEGLAQGVSEAQSPQILRELPILSATETQHLVEELNDTAMGYPQDKCIHQLFEQQTQVEPNNIALAFAGQQLSYKQLNEKANQLAHYLSTHHAVKPDTLVGLCVERSMEMIVAILAILKAGGAYVPLDPAYPQARLSYMLEDAALDVVLTQTHVQKILADFSGSVVLLDGLATEQDHFCAAQPNTNMTVADSGLTSANLAYVIYTSGSTGKPKGVELEHQSVLNYLTNTRDYLSADIEYSVMSTSLNFDATVTSLFGAWLDGGYVTLLDEQNDIFSGLSELMRQKEAGLFKVTPAHLQGLEFDTPVLTPHVVVVGGEPFSFDLATKITKQMPNTHFINEYGPTETTVGCSYQRFTLNDIENHREQIDINIGKPIINSHFYVLNEHLQLLPQGSIGQLYIGGAGLARGYLNRPELTAERFIDNPFYDQNKTNSSPRLYKTGDLVQYLSDGNLMFIGRVDEQVKIRGFRIELGEVEAQLLQLDNIDSALVLATQLAGSQQLVGYVKPTGVIAETDLADYVTQIKSLLAEQLPEHMIPAIIMTVEQWPLTPNGKVDKKALPAPDGSGLQGAYVAAQTETEQVLVDIWAGLLNMKPESISTTANFFELGGHSLLCVRLVSEIRSRCKTEIAVQCIFDTPSLQALAAVVEQDTQAVARPPISSVERNSDKVAVSFAQQRLWFIDNLQGGSPEYNIPTVFEVAGILDTTLVTKVFNTILARHEILRTVYVDQGGESLQHIRSMSEVTFEVEQQDLSHLSGTDLDKQMKVMVEAAITKPFDLTKDLMLRISYVKKTPDAGVIIFNMHHIASDGWSMEVLTKEFFALYQAYEQGQSNPLAELVIQYADYAHWQREYLAGQVLESQLNYWQKQLSELPATHDLPLSHGRPTVKQHKGAVVSSVLPSSTAEQLLGVAKTHQLTPFMLLHGALSLLLSRHSNSNDIVIGTPVANRLQSELEPLIGFFVNTLVLRADTKHDTLLEYFAHIRQVHLEAQSNQDVPFEQLVERLNAPRSTAHSPLFQIMMTTNTDYGLTDGEEQLSTIAGVDIKPYQSDFIQAKFDLNVDLSISEQGVGLHWTYDVSLLSKQYITQLNDHMCRLLGAISEGVSQSQSLDALPMLSGAEIHYLKDELNDTAMDYSTATCIHQLFEQQVRENPDNVAVVFKDQQLTYQQLNEKANQLARYLRAEHDIKPDTLVGLCVERSMEMVIGIMGILKSGGAYVPLDPDYPQERLSFMIEDAGLNVVLSQTQVQQALCEFNGTVLTLDGMGHTDEYFCNKYDHSNLTTTETELVCSNLAYVIYTSGSTGQPKGVLIEQRSVNNLICSQKQTFKIDDCSGEAGLVLASYAFDAAVEQMFLMLLSSNTLVVPAKQEILEPQALMKLIAAHQVTHIHATPSYLMNIVECLNYQSIKRVISGGEVMLPQLYDAINPAITLYNEYGPTETCVTSSVSLSAMSIGKPIGNTIFYVLSDGLALTPIGAVGELFIGGDGLARGYLNRPELTAERFIDNPFYDQSKANSSSRLYKTGDLVRYLPDGTLAFIGRSDDQVKIRGFRIELGEVETQLSQLETVDSALVMAKELGTSQQLLGYVKPLNVVDETDVVDYVSKIKSLLGAHLPDYMVPEIIMVVEQWPLTANGKLDKNALPTPMVDGTVLQGEYVAPKTDTEQVLVDIWARLLNISPESISSTANFFELGGHSLLMMRLVSEVRTHCHVELSIQSIFDSAMLAQLAQVIEHNSQVVTRPPISRVERASDRMPVSFAQQRLWFIDNLQGNSTEYNMPMAFEVDGQLNIALVSDVFNTIIERHEILRTVYVEQEGETLQIIRPLSDVNFEIDVQDISHLTGNATDEASAQQIKTLVEADITKPFDLATSMMLRVSYIKKTQTSGVIIFNIHHIASDGWSMEILTKEFFALYQAYSQGQSNPLPELAVQYADFAHWQREYLAGEVLQVQLEYWQKNLDELPATHNLPLSYPRPAVKQHQGAVISGQLPASTAKQLLDVAKTYQLTPFMLLHGALSLLLSRHSNSDDIVIGTPVANRLQTELEPLIGFFVNTLVLRANTNHDTLSDYFDHIRQTHLDAQSNQDVPFEQLVERLDVSRSTAHSPLFQIMMTANTDYGLNHQQDQQSLALPGLDIQPYSSDIIQAKFDLDIVFNISEQGLSLNWTYDVSLFTKAYITALNSHLCRLLEGLSQAPSTQTLGELPMLSATEVQHLVYDLNDTAADYPQQTCVHQLFEQLADNNPEHVAALFGEQQLTYKQLNEKANQLAHYLRANHDIKPDTLVGLCVERSLEMLIGTLGILKAGGAYVPLDPNYPQERLHYMLADTALEVVLSTSNVTHVMAGFKGTTILLDAIADTNNHFAQAYANSNLSTTQTGLSTTNLAYIIYTSGSTGKPKGVMIEHRGLTNTAINNAKYFGLKQEDVVYQSGAIGFDITSWVIWMSLCSCSTLRLSSGQDHLKDLLHYDDITYLMMTPSMLDLVDPALVSHVKSVISGGESCPTELYHKWQSSGVKFYNGYGPTEITICCSLWSGQDGLELSLGKATGNTQFYLFNRVGELVPQGCVGELYVGGDGLARGYLNRPDLTAQSFIENPFYDQSKTNSSSRLYKTGDLVRYLPDGNLEFVGRVDDQVKIRGFRIELGEIEVQLNQLESVDSAFVIAKELSGSPQLMGYVKPNDEITSTQVANYVSQIKSVLGEQLPAHMVPSIIMVVEQWPLTPNGKIDRKALPIPDGNALQGEYIAAKTEIEHVLVDIWAKLLKIEPQLLSVTANFFELGGHSLLCIRLASEIRSRLCVEISIQSIFDTTSLQTLAQLIEQNTQAVSLPTISVVERDSNSMPVSFAQQRLWFIDNLQGGSPEYNMPMIFEVEGHINITIVTDVFNTIIERHEVLRTVYLEQGGETLQIIRPISDVEFEIVVKDLSHLKGEDLAQQVKTLVEADITKPFDLATDLMLRVSYAKKTADTGVLIFNMHHIASDGWSMEVLTKEFFALYQAYKQGQSNPLTELTIQYADFAQQQREYLTDEVLTAQLGYWQKQLDELPAVHSIPLNFTRPEVKQHKGAMVIGELPASTAKQLFVVAKSHQLTPFMLLHGALSLLLSRHSNSTDIVIGTPVANRLQSELEPLIGFFVNTLVLRANTKHDTLSTYFAHIRQVHLDAQSNQDVPFEQLVERLNVPRSMAHSPLFQIMMTTNTDYGLNRQQDNASMNSNDVNIKPYQSDIIQSKFDLNVDLNISEQGVGLHWTYDVSLLSKQYITQLNDHMCRLLGTISEGVNHSQPLNALPMLSSTETHHLKDELNDTVMDYSGATCIHQSFEQQVTENPDNVAVIFEDQQLTYQQLNNKANQLARYLRTEYDIKPDTLVGLCVERSMEMVIGIMAILKSGGAYVPLDPDYPQERLSFMIEDAGLDVVLSQTQVLPVLSEFNGTVLTLDGMGHSDEHLCSEYDHSDLMTTETGLGCSNLAYVIYTSGSTGQPKGVLIEQRSVNNLITSQKQTFKIDDCSGEAGLVLASYAFDAAVEQMFLMLLSSNTLVVPAKQEVLEPQALMKLIAAHQVTHIHSTPSYLMNIVECLNYQSIKRVISGGEVMLPQLYDAINPAIPLYNEYGPTETCVTSSVSLSAMSIGKPIGNTLFYVLSDGLALTPMGGVGELYIGGDGLARGYLNRPELTAERFIDNPFYDQSKANSSSRLYKTGDLVRYLPDGNLAFIGRSDDQVKIRGFRIELGEVETQLSQLETVDSALVMAKELGDNQQLVGYVKPLNVNDDMDMLDYVSKIKSLLSAQLPEYMIPSIIMAVEQWPLTANGKLDKKALPAPDGRALQEEYVAANTDTEQGLVDIWAELLGISSETISTTANFFEMGGHSLLTIKLLSLIHTRFEKTCELSALYNQTTIQSQALMIDSLERGLNSTELLHEITDCSAANKGIIFIPGVASTDRDFMEIVELLQQNNTDAGIGIFRHKGLIAGETFFATIEQNVIAFADRLARQPFKQVTLVGHSYGGALALELANQLKAQGYQIELVMLDTYFEQQKLKLSAKQQPTDNIGLDEQDIPAHLRELYQHQSNLFNQYQPKIDNLLPIKWVFARTSPFVQQQYIDYLKLDEAAQQMKAQQMTYLTVDGDHFSMLKNKSAQLITKLLI